VSASRSLERSYESPRAALKTHAAAAAVWLLVLAFVVSFAILSLRRHAALATNGMDLGNVNQALWNTAHGDFLAFTNMAPVRSRLALHVEPILLLLVPFYWVGLGGPRLLLAVQALVVGLGALPLYWLARSVLPAAYPLLTAVFPLAYLLLPALEAAVMYDFHAVTLAPTFLLFALYFVERGRPAPFTLFTGLAIACKEDMGLTVAMLGLYVMLARRRWRWGGLTVLVGLAWFAAAVFLVQPLFSPTGGNVQAERYAWLGDTPGAMLGSLVSRPGLVWDHVWKQADLATYLGGLLLPTAFLPLLAPLAWLPALPSLAVNLLSDNAFTWRLEDFHYAAPMAPFFLVAAVYGVRRLADWTGRWSQAGRRYSLWAACGLLLAASLTYHYARGFSPLAQPYQAWPVGQHERRAEAVFARVPPQAALFAQSNLNPHLSGRRVVYQDPALLIDAEVRGELPAPDYLLFDVSSLVNQDDFQRFIASELLAGDAFGPALAVDGFLLLQRGAESKPLPDEFFDFARASAEEITHPLAADFGDAVRLRGFDLYFKRAEEVQPVLYFEALRPLDEDYFLCLYLLDAWGEFLGATIEDQPALVWYPTRRWQPGELIKVTFNTFPWNTRDVSGYRLALGVMRGRDPWQPGARLSPILPPEASPAYALRLPGDGTLLEFARLRRPRIAGIAAGRPEGGPPERLFQEPRMGMRVDLSLANRVRLLGYDMDWSACLARPEQDGEGPTSAAESQACRLELTLYWQAEAAPDVDYTVFVHVVRPDGHLVAQRDAPPDAGAYPIRRWAAGEVMVDPLRISVPSEVRPAELEVWVGMYDPNTGQRLPVLDAAGRPVDDKVVLSPRTPVQD
jgi:uncharacterized membrane protein